MPDYSRYQTLQIDCADQVATVTLNRPASLNAVNEQMHTELETLFAEVAYDDESREMLGIRLPPAAHQPPCPWPGTSA